MIKQYFKNLFSKKSVSGAGLSAIIKNATGFTGNRYRRWVYACITTIAKGIAQTDWTLAQVTSKGVNEIESHELLSLLYKFNPRTTKYNSLYLTIVYFLKDGEVAWILNVPDGRKKPTELYVVPTSTLQVSKKNEDGTPAMYKFTVGTKVNQIPADLVKIFINPDPDNPTKGLSSITAMSDVVDNDTRMVRWNKSLLQNSATPSGNIEVQGSLDPKQAKMLREQFESMNSGFENAGKVNVLTNGAKFTPSGIAPKDMEFVEGRKMNRDEILAIFGVPKIILGLEGDYNRATAETAERMFAKYTLQPIMTMLVEQINIAITPLYGQGLWLDFEQFDTEDREQKLNEQTAGYNKWLTTNEIREQNGLPPVIGGDKIYIPLNLVPTIGGEQEVKTIELDAIKKTDYTPNQEREIRMKVASRDYILESKNKDVADRIMKKMSSKNKEFKMRIVKGTTNEKKKEIWEQFEKTRKQIEKLFIKKLQGLFESQKQKVFDNLDLQEKELKSEPFNLKEEIDTTIGIIEPQYYEALTLGAKLASEISDIDYVDITNIPSVREWAVKLSEKYATEITELTYEKTIDTIQDAVREGLGTDELAKNIGDLFDNMAETRSQVIARTESARALTAGQANEWDQAGVKTFEWLTSQDDKVSEICQYNETQDWTAKQAKEGTIAHSHPNCRCVFLPK